MSQVLSKKIAQITSQFRSQDTYGERENRAYSTSSQCGAPEDGKSGGAFQGQMGYPKGMKAAGELCHGANPVTAPSWPQRLSAALHCCKYSHRPNWLLATSRDQPRSAAALSQVPDLANETKNNATVVSVFSNLRQFALLLTLKSMLSNDRKMLFSDTLVLKCLRRINILRYNYFLWDEIKW